MTHLVHVNGELVPAAEASVSVRDRGFLYGDGVFETLRVYGGTPFEWDRHLARMRRSLDHVGMAVSLEELELRKRVDATLQANGWADAYVRVSLTRGVQPGRLTPEEVVDPTVVVLAEPLPRGGITGERVWADPATCTIATTQRIPSAAIPAAAKTHNYLNGILARLEARTRARDEAIMLDAEGHLTEGATSNLFFVDDGRLHTPTVTALPVLPGITREVVIELAEGRGVSVLEGTWSESDLARADEAFLTNSTWEVRPIDRIDEHSYTVGSVTTTLTEAFDERIERTCYDRSSANNTSGQ